MKKNKTSSYINMIKDALDNRGFDSISVDEVGDEIVVIVSMEHREIDFTSKYEHKISHLNMFDKVEELNDFIKDFGDFMQEQVEAKISSFDYNN